MTLEMFNKIDQIYNKVKQINEDKFRVERLIRLLKECGKTNWLAAVTTPLKSTNDVWYCAEVSDRILKRFEDALLEELKALDMEFNELEL